MTTPAPPLAGPWPDVRDLVGGELERYLEDAGRPEVRLAATRCTPWTGDQVTIHLAETFARFRRMLARARNGDLTDPFSPGELDAENLRAVEAFEGDPLAALREEATGFCAEADDPAEVMAHQFGPIPVGLQLHFGLADLAIHHDDVLAAVGARYTPSPDVVAALVEVWRQLFGFRVDRADTWAALLAHSGR